MTPDSQDQTIQFLNSREVERRLQRLESQLKSLVALMPQALQTPQARQTSSNPPIPFGQNDDGYLDDAYFDDACLNDVDLRDAGLDVTDLDDADAFIREALQEVSRQRDEVALQLVQLPAENDESF